jgi:hypothetical protein
MASMIRTSSRVEHPSFCLIQCLKAFLEYVLEVTPEDGALGLRGRGSDAASPRKLLALAPTGVATGAGVAVGVGIGVGVGVGVGVGAGAVFGSGTPDCATPPWPEHVPRPSLGVHVPSLQIEPACAGGANSASEAINPKLTAKT